MSHPRWIAGAATLSLLGAYAPPSLAQLDLGPEEVLQSGGVDIEMPNEAAAACVDWDEDGRNDLVVTNGYSSAILVKVRVFLNVGTAEAPQFNGYFYAQAGGADLEEPGSG